MTTLEAILEGIRRRCPKVRITAQRRLVLEVLLANTSRHLTCEDVTQAVTARSVALDQSTVYRILQWLKAAGVVSQTDLGLHSDVYALVTGHTHHHLVCLACGAILDIEDSTFDNLRESIQEIYRFHPRIEHFAIFGFCEHCINDDQ